MKKIGMIFLWILLLASVAVYAEDSVSGESLKELGLIEGDGSGLNESGDITREAMVKMMVCMTTDLSADFDLPETPTFSDVPVDHWAYSWVERAYAAGLTNGIGGGLFGLGQDVTKQQVSAFMMNILKEEYTYDNVEHIAVLSRSLTTLVTDKFNRGNAFEMVAKTLVEIPVGEETPVYAMTHNFEDKNFKKILSSITLRHDEAQQARAILAAQEAKKAEIARLADQKIHMDAYRSTWPASQEEYLVQLDHMTRLLEKDWQSVEVESLNEDSRKASFYVPRSIDEHIGVKVTSDGRVALNAVNFKNTDQASFFLNNVRLEVVNDHGATRISGDFEEEKYVIMFVQDTNSDSNKGWFKTGDRVYTSRLTSHPTLSKYHTAYNDVIIRYRNEGFIDISMSKMKRLLKEDVSLDIITQGAVEHEPNSFYIYDIGLDQRSYKLSSIYWKNGSCYFEVTQKSDGSSKTARVERAKLNADGDILGISLMYDDDYRSLVIKFDEDQSIKSAVLMAFKSNGIYTKE